MLELNLWLQRIATPFWDSFFLFISNLTNELLYVAIVAAIYYTTDKKKGIKMAVMVMTNMSLNFFLKDIFRIDRPYVKNSEIVNKDIETGYGYSFPSGHSQFNSGFYTALATQFNVRKFYALIILFVITVAFSRIYLGVHSVLDVICGVLLGFLWVVLINRALDKILSGKLYLLYLFSLIGIINILLSQNTDSIKILLLYFGFIIGYSLDLKFVNYEVPKKALAKILNVSIFIAGLLIIQIIFSFFKFGVIKYFIIGIWATFLCPLLCKRKVMK